MPTFKQNLQSIRRARKQIETRRAQLYRARMDAQRRFDETPNGTPDAEVRRALAAPTQALDEATARLHEAMGVLHTQRTYTDVVENLDAGMPVVLLPVRIETRFVTTGQRPQLWLRVYPDDIHVHAFEEQLTDNEVAIGRSYWRALLKINRGDADDKDALKTAAWTTLAKRLGPRRALWVVKKTQPTNWQPDLDIAPEALDFADAGVTKTHDWTRAPQTQLLPDRFVVNIYRGNRVLPPIVGRRVPDTVFLGPDPFLAEQAFKETDKKITFDESFAWTSDFAQAVKKGLGFKIPIRRDMLNRGRIDRIVVLGVMASADAKESRTLMDAHLQAQRFSPKGLSFLPVGTPTNNTDTSNSEYKRNDPYLPNGHYDGVPATRLSELPDCDGLAFARVLGVSADPLSEVRNAQDTALADARAMNDALYPATIGHFVEVLSQPALTPGAKRALRSFFREHVSSSGPVPSLRIGDQPYGVLVTSDLTRWNEPRDSDPFAHHLLRVLSRLQRIWASIARTQVAHVGKSGDASKIMLDILGLAPGSQSFKQRLGHTNDVPLTDPTVSSQIRGFTQKQDRVMGLLREAGFLGQQLPLISALGFYRRNDRVPAHLLVDRKHVSATRFLDKLGSDDINFIEWLTQVRSVNDLKNHALPGARPPRSVLYLLLRHSILQTLHKATVNLYKTKGFDFSRSATEKSLFNFDRQTQDLSAWEMLSGKPNKVDRRKLPIAEAAGDHLLKRRANVAAVRELTVLRRACQRLAKLPTQTLYRDLTAHLDLCSYRLDAWQTGMFARRLEARRERQSEGLFLGAYGWVENLRPNARDEVSVPDELAPPRNQPVQEMRGNAGFVHTPSLNHATAAGVLLAGYRNNASKEDPDAFAINMSSARMRRATAILQGVQNGQSLEALLGYQFERALHDRTSADPSVNLNQHILPIREKFPIEHASVPQAGAEAQETVPAYSVVNGMALVEAKAAQLNALSLPANALTAVREEIDGLRDALDAMGDLLTSEAAYQLVQGKGDRLAGVLNSFKDATQPPEFEVNKTPRSTELSVNNKVCLALRKVEALDAADGWASRLTPRAATEPGINRWLGHQLGRASRIVCSVAQIDGEERLNRRKFSLADLNLQPIDFVYQTGIDVHAGARDLEAALFAAYQRTVPLADDTRVIVEYDSDMANANERSVAQVLPLARYLRLLITTGRPASAADFMPRSKSLDTQPEMLFGWNVTELDERIERVAAGLAQILLRLDRRAPNRVRPRTPDNPATLGEVFQAFAQTGGDREWLAGIELADSAVQVLREFMQTMPLYGVRVSSTAQQDSATSSGRVELLAAAAAARKEAYARLATAEEKRAEAAAPELAPDLAIRRLTDAGKALLGDDFVLLPEFKFHNASDVRASLRQKSRQLLKHYAEVHDTTASLAIETWLQSLSPVRPALQRLEQVRIVNEFHGVGPLAFEAMQLPFRDKDSWLAVEYPEFDPETGEPFALDGDTLSICVSGLAHGDAGRRQRMLMLDEWSEAVPSDREVTGVAFHYNQPNATAPNAVLVAVEPTGGPTWSWDALLGTVSDTLDRAKTRAVEPAQLLEHDQLDVLLPMTVAAFDLNETQISLDYLAVDDDLIARLRPQFPLYRNFD